MEDLDPYNIDGNPILSLMKVYYLQAKQKFLLYAQRCVQTLQNSTSSPARNSKSSLPLLHVSIRGNIQIIYIGRTLKLLFKQLSQSV